MEELGELAKRIVQFPLFKELENHRDGLSDLTSLMKREYFNVREFIIDEKVNDSRLYLLMDGQVEINKMDEHGRIIVLGKADAATHPCFGESVLFGKFNRSANVIAWTHCECLSLAAKDFEGFMARHPYVVASFFRNLSKLLFERLMSADRDVFIASMLLKL